MFGELDRLADHPEYVQPRTQLELEQQVDGALLFPTLGVLLQRPLAHDIDALHATYTRSTAGCSRSGASAHRSTAHPSSS